MAGRKGGRATEKNGNAAQGGVCTHFGKAGGRQGGAIRNLCTDAQSQVEKTQEQGGKKKGEPDIFERSRALFLVVAPQCTSAHWARRTGRDGLHRRGLARLPGANSVRGPRSAHVTLRALPNRSEERALILRTEATRRGIIAAPLQRVTPCEKQIAALSIRPRVGGHVGRTDAIVNVAEVLTRCGAHKNSICGATSQNRFLHIPQNRLKFRLAGVRQMPPAEGRVASPLFPARRWQPWDKVVRAGNEPPGCACTPGPSTSERCRKVCTRSLA